MKYLSLLVLSVILSSVPASLAKSSKENSIHELLRLTKAAEMGRQFSKQMFAMLKVQIPDDKKTCFDNATLAVELKMTGEKFAQMLTPVYDKHFTDKEIKGLVAFYKTPLGKKLLEKQPMIMQDSMLAGQQWGQESSTLLQKELAQCK